MVISLNLDVKIYSEARKFLALIVEGIKEENKEIMPEKWVVFDITWHRL